MGIVYEGKYIGSDEDLVEAMRGQVSMSSNSSYYNPNPYLTAAADLIERQKEKIEELEADADWNRNSRTA